MAFTFNILPGISSFTLSILKFTIIWEKNNISILYCSYRLNRKHKIIYFRLRFYLETSNNTYLRTIFCCCVGVFFNLNLVRHYKSESSNQCLKPFSVQNNLFHLCTWWMMRIHNQHFLKYRLQSYFLIRKK